MRLYTFCVVFFFNDSCVSLCLVLLPQGEPDSRNPKRTIRQQSKCVCCVSTLFFFFFFIGWRRESPVLTSEYSSGTQAILANRYRPLIEWDLGHMGPKSACRFVYISRIAISCCYHSRRLLTETDNDKLKFCR